MCFVKLSYGYQSLFSRCFLNFCCTSSFARSPLLEDDPSPFYGSFLTVVRLGIFGDYDLLELEGLTPTLIYEENAGGYKSIAAGPGPNYTAIHGLYYIIGMGITVLLMNLLIGVLGQNFDIYQDQSTMLYLQARAKMLRQIRDRPWRITCLHRKRLKETLSVARHAKSSPVFVALTLKKEPLRVSVHLCGQDHFVWQNDKSSQQTLAFPWGPIVFVKGCSRLCSNLQKSP